MSTPVHLRGSEFWKVSAALLLVFSFVYYGGVLSPRAASRWADLWWAAFSLAAAVRSFVAARRCAPGHERRGWNLLGFAALSWFAGMSYLIAGWLRDPDFAYYPTPANLLFAAFAPLFAAGVYALRSASARLAKTRIRVANLVIIFSSSLLMAVVVLLEPLLASSRSTAVVALAILDPALFLAAALFTLSCLLWCEVGRMRHVFLWASGAISLHALSDMLYFQNVLIGPAMAANGLDKSWLDILWLLAFGLQIGAAEEADATRNGSSPAAANGRRGPQLIESLFPAALVLAVVVTAMVFAEDLTLRVFVASAPLLVVLAVSVALREYWSHRESARLYRQLREASEQSRHLLAASPAVIFAGELRPDLELTFASARFQGLGVGDEPRHLLESMEPMDRDLLRRRLDAIDGAGEVVLAARLRRPDGELRWIDLHLMSSVREGRREVVGSAIDATERRRLEAHVVRAQREESLGKLAGGVAHDFNNLLTTIQCHAEFAREALGDETAMSEALESILGAVDKGAGLTRQLLSFSRPNLDRLATVDAGDVVRRLLDLIRRVLGEDIELVVLVGTEPIFVCADPGRLEQVVMNLVLNARDAMPEGGRLVVELRAVSFDDEAGRDLDLTGGDYALLRVSDTGEGMSRETLARLFEPFFTTKGVGRGTGLGLATVHGIVKRHGGRVDVSSRPGVGSEFRVYLPQAQPSAGIASGSVA